MNGWMVLPVIAAIVTMLTTVCEWYQRSKAGKKCKYP
jgi:hypothetical protein